MKVYSYLQSGKPVVATRLFTHTQVMNDEVSVLVEPEANAMAEGMSNLIASPQEREKIGNAGKAYVQKEFSEQRFRQRLHDFYLTLPGMGRPGETSDRQAEVA